MKCCQSLVDGITEDLPFKRTVSTAYYDGPTDGFTECSQCQRAYCFRKLDWDDLQDVRIFAFAPLGMNLETIIARLGVSIPEGRTHLLLPQQDAQDEKYIQSLSAGHPTRVAAVSGWPGQSSVWRDIGGLDLEKVKDWFEFLGIPKATE